MHPRYLVVFTAAALFGLLATPDLRTAQGPSRTPPTDRSADAGAVVLWADLPGRNDHLTLAGVRDLPQAAEDLPMPPAGDRPGAKDQTPAAVLDLVRQAEAKAAAREW